MQFRMKPEYKPGLRHPRGLARSGTLAVTSDLYVGSADLDHAAPNG
jgi:hypothetical protein